MTNLSSDTAHADRIKTDPINYACDIFTDIKKMVGEAFLEARKNSTELKIEEILSEVQQKYIVFTRQYPLVIRLMVVEDVFNKKAFERYVRYLVTNTPKSKEDIIWGQATWIKYLYIEQTPHADRIYANKLVEDMYRQLKKEREEMDAILKKSEEKRNTLPETDENSKPELAVDDEFAKRFGEFENLDALKKRLRENIKQDKQIKLKDKKRAEILDAVSKESKIEYPKILLDAELSKMTGEIKENLSGMGISWENYLEHIKKKEEDLAKEWEKEADKRVRYGLTLRQIAIAEKIEVAPEELEKEIELIMSRYQAEDKSKLDRQRLEDYAYGILRNERVFIVLETSEIN